MGTKARPRLLTAEEFEQRRNHKGYELVDGRLRRKAMGAEASRIQSEFNFLLRLWARQTLLGQVYDSECMYQCFPAHPRRVRKPDVSFVRSDRLPGGQSPAGMFRIRPDFVVEVLSPKDKIFDLNTKLADYRAAGVPLVWVVYPDLQAVAVHDPGSEPRTVPADGVLTGDPVLPGFTVRVAELFRPASTPRT